MIRIRAVPSDGGFAGPIYDLGVGWFSGQMAGWADAVSRIDVVSRTHVSQVVTDYDVEAETVTENRIEYFGRGLDYETRGQQTVRVGGTVDTIVYTSVAEVDGTWHPGRSWIIEFDPGVDTDPFVPAAYLGGCVVIGTQLDDHLWGADGPDRLLGDLGDDNLQGAGGDGSDTLVAGPGDDVVHGGRGKDLLAGNSGADVFRFDYASDAGVGRTRDVITAFQVGRDKIDLSLMRSESPPAPGADPGFEFIGSDPFGGTKGELRYSHGILAGDRNGDGVSDFQIEIGNRAAITEDDLIL